MEPVLLDKNAAVEPVSARPAALEDNVVMTVAGEHRVDLVHPPRPAPMDFVLEQPHLTVLEDNAETTELVETVEVAQQDRDAVQDFVNAIMTVTRETVVQQFKLTELISVCAHKDLVEPAPLVSLVELLEDVQLKHPVMSLSRLLIVPPDVQLPQLPQFSLLPPL